MDLHELSDRFVLALTIWGEARGEPVEGQIAVAQVVRNRLSDATNTAPRWRDVCLAPKQFSCFNENDPNYPKIQRAATMLLTQEPTPELRQALWIADGVMGGMLMDNTKGSRNYLTFALYGTKPPKWAVNKPIKTRIGSHVFLTA